MTSRGTEIFEIDADEVPADAWPKYVKVTVARAKMNKNGTYGTTFTSVFHYNHWPHLFLIMAKTIAEDRVAEWVQTSAANCVAA